MAKLTWGPSYSKDIAEQAADKAYVAKKAAMTPDELAQEDEKYEL